MAGEEGERGRARVGTDVGTVEDGGDFERRLYSSCNVHELLSVSEAAESKEDSGDGMRKT